MSNKLPKRSQAIMKSMRGLIPILIVAFALQASAAEQMTALKCGTLLDVTSRVVLEDVTVLVEGQRIAAVERTMTPPAGATVIDLGDWVCLPGLMDMHIHLMYLDEGGMKDKATESSAELTLTGYRNALKMLNYGFTTLRVPGDNDPEFGIVALRDAINQGVVTGPRMFVAPHLLQPIWGQFHITTENDKNDLVSAGADAARDAVRSQVRHGADFIKVAADAGGIMKDEITRMFTEEEIGAFADEARRLNKRITAHAHGEGAARSAVMSGYDSIEHGFYLSESTAKEMKKRGTYLVPTLGVYDIYFDERADFSRFGFDFSPNEGMADRRKKRDEAFKFAYKIGVKMAFGTDEIWPDMAGREFSYLSRLGVSNWDAIAMATINGADLLGMKDQLGSISVGKFADIIALPENPLDNIEAMEKVSFVMKGGNIVRRE